MKMDARHLLLCLAVVCAASADGPLNPRGARPVEHGTRSEKCASQKEWPFCTSDEWGPKCPSGCRLQGLMDKNDHNLLKRIEKIRHLLDQNKADHRSADTGSKETYDILRERLTTDAGHDNNYFNLAQNLRRQISEMKIKIDRQLRLLAALKDRVRDQVTEMQRLEVDIDIKLRACKGSCKTHTEYQVDQESYVVLDKQVNQLNTQEAQSVESVRTLYVMKSLPLRDAPSDGIHKSRPVDDPQTAQQTEDVFPEVNNVYFVLEEEGSSSSSPATITKVPVCVRLSQQSQDGRQLSGGGGRGRGLGRRCPAQWEHSLCSDDDWLHRCPSGCRLQGLMSRAEAELEAKLGPICRAAKTCEDHADESRRAMAELYNSNRELLVSRHVSELKMAEQAGDAARNLTSLRRRSARLALRLEELRLQALQQLRDLQRTEVDVDMKLRACGGSCRRSTPFAFDLSAYGMLETDLDRVRRPASAPRDPPHLSLRTSIPGVRRELLDPFGDLGQNHMVLEELQEGQDQPE